MLFRRLLLILFTGLLLPTKMFALTVDHDIKEARKKQEKLVLPL
jgi:hypothetical protein